MPRAADGTPFHSHGQARLHDEMAKETTKKAGATDLGKHETGAEAEHTMAEAHPPDSKESIHEVVAEHGPAHTIHSHHDHEGGEHHVSSFHGDHKPGHAGADGFTHHSTHATHHEAHEHMGHALGIGGAGEEKDHEQYETPATEETEMARAGGGIPGLS